MGRALVLGLIFANFGLILAQVQNIDTYFLIGGDLELRPPSGTTKDITNVQWKRDGSFVAEWSRGEQVEVYGAFKGRVDLNTTSGCLVIRGMTEAEAGDYTLDINNNQLDVKYVVKSLKKVPTPHIWIKPAVDKSENLEGVCEGDVKGAEPVTYWWNLGVDRAWVELGPRIVISDNETTRLIETFSCKIKNPVSEEESDPHDNPLFPKAQGASALGALAIIPIALLVGLGIGVFVKKDAIRARFCAGQDGATRNGRVDPAEGAGVPLSTPTGSEAAPGQ